MDNKLWAVVVVLAGLFAAAWIYMDLNKRYWQGTEKNIHTMMDEVDSMANPMWPDMPIEEARKRSGSVSQRMQALPQKQMQRTDSVQRIIRQDNLLGNGTK